jgi:4-amino-4-deoxy-L-arabinose transferase-like glycosyltransferase
MPIATRSPAGVRAGYLLPLLAIVLVAAFVRINGLTAQSLWLDEVLTWRSASAPFDRFYSTLLLNENTPPLFFLLTNLWTKAFGDSDAMLRLPAAIFGIAGVAAMYWLGREAWGSREALLAALLMALSPYHVWYSQEARGYSLLVLLVIVSTACLCRMLRQHAPWTQVAYVVASAAGLYTHPFMGLILVAQNLFLLGRWAWMRGFSAPPDTPGLTLRRWLTLQGAILVLFAWWINKLITLIGVGQPWLTHTTPLLNAFLSYSGSRALAVLLAGMILIAIGCAALKWHDPTTWLALLLMAVPILGLWLISTPEQPVFHTRYGTSAIVGLFLLSARGMALLRPWARTTVVALYIGISAMGLTRPGGARYPEALIKPDLRSPTLIVCREAGQGEVVVLSPRWWIQAVFDRYCRRRDLIRCDLTNIPPDRDRGWLIIPTSAAKDALDALHKTRFEPVEHRHFEQIELYRLQKVNAEPDKSGAMTGEQQGPP